MICPRKSEHSLPCPVVTPQVAHVDSSFLLRDFHATPNLEEKPFFFFLKCICFFEKQRYPERDTLDRLAYSPQGHDKLELGQAQSRSQKFTPSGSALWVTETQTLEPSSAAFAGASAGTWTASPGVRTGGSAPTCDADIPSSGFICCPTVPTLL